ncbi:MAG TPA: VOC family protein [Steroidobacteraceae bacterium]|nr:VOC family protein [Steroidobacteraceae bacterium]
MKVVPMIHVPDVRATARWYEEIGFRIERVEENQGTLDRALLSFGETQIVLDAGGRPSNAPRREVDLYVETRDVDRLYLGLKDRVEIVEPPHDTFAGMREFIIRDPNRFWMTFGEPQPAPN